MAYGACKYEEVEDGVHEGALVEGVKEGSGDIAYAFCYYPCKGCGYGVYEWFERNKAGEAHEDEAGCLYVAVVF